MKINTFSSVIESKYSVQIQPMAIYHPLNEFSGASEYYYEDSFLEFSPHCALNFWESLSKKYSNIRNNSELIKLTGIEDSKKQIKNSCVPVSTLLFAISLGKRGRNLLSEIIHGFKSTTESISLILNDCSVALPAGSSDITALRSVPQFIESANYTQSRLWLHEVIKSSTKEDIAPGLFNNNEQILKVMTFNLFGVPSIIAGKCEIGKGRYEKILHALKNSQCGIIGLQEVWNSASRNIIENSGYPYIANISEAGKFLNASGLITLSKYPILKEEKLTFSKRSGLESVVKKGALYTLIDIPNIGEVDVYNVHLASEPERANKFFIKKDKADEVRLQQLQELNDWIWSRSHESRPVIILGDLNIDEAETAAYSKLMKLCPWDTYRIRQGTPSLAIDNNHKQKRRGVTFDPTKNKYAFADRNIAERLDYIFYRPFGSNLPAIGSQRLFVDDPISDHYAVETTFRFIE